MAHQDYTYWDHVYPADLATCWIAIDDATVDNGCMYVVPGSHRWDLDYSREDVDVTDPEWLLKRADLPAKVQPVPCEVPAGHCHFHHCRTFHGSYGNKTDNPRRSYVMHLMPGHIRRGGNDWNDRMASVEGVGVGEIVQAPATRNCRSRLSRPFAAKCRETSFLFFLRVSSWSFVPLRGYLFSPACRSETRPA